jgi:hypothetical protein
VRYAEQLRRFEDAFGAENLLVLIYDDFRADNEATLRRVLRFVGADDTVPLRPLETKPLKAVRAMPLHHLAGSLRLARAGAPSAGPLARALNAITPGALRSERARALWRRAVYKAPEPADERLMLELRRRFKPEVLALSEHLDRDLVSEWGYEAL